MSGRIRTIKPELLEDAVTAGLSDSAFRVFIAMILLADDYGNLRAEAKYLDGQIYWSAVAEKAVSASCDELDTLVRFYEVRGQRYAHIRGWDKHQRVQHAGKARVPGPPDDQPRAVKETLVNVSGDSQETLAPDLRPPTSDLRPPSVGSPRDSRAEVSEPEPEPDQTAIRRISSRPPPPESVEPEEPAKPESGYDMAKRVWNELWPAKYRGRYPYAPDSGPQSDDRTLQRLGGMAYEWALLNSTREQYVPNAERWLRHVVAGYLRDHGDKGWLDGKRHPLRTLLRDIVSYGEPPAAKSLTKLRAAPAEPVAPALSVEQQGQRAAEAMKAMGKIGMGGRT